MSTSAPSNPRAANVRFDMDCLIVELVDGRVIHVPVEWFPTLRDATEEQRAGWRLIGHGLGIHWEALDEDLSVRGLLVSERAAA